MLTLHRAAWVLPVAAPPIRDGWVAIDAGRVAAVGGPHDLPPLGVQNIRRHDAAILPGLVNAHTHLELSWLAGRVPPAESMGRWIRAMMALRRGTPPSEDAQREAIAAAVTSARATGTAAFGDIGNTVLSADILASAGVPAVLFHELLGFGAGDMQARAREGAERVIGAARRPVRPGLAPHAPYSVSPQLFRSVMDEAGARGLPASVHLGESRDEVEFLMHGTGEIAETLRHLGAWNDAWTPPGTDPAEYLDRLGVLRPGLLSVHNTQLAPSALRRLADRGCVLVSCPRSNRWVGAGDPPLDAFYASTAPVVFGTDSLASAPDLDMFAELAAARLISTVPAGTLIDSATRGGAAALGFDADLGTIEPGKLAALVAVPTPPGLADVEEYLVSGIRSSDIVWIEPA